MQRVTLNVFDVRSGKVLREFKGSADDFATGGTGGVAGVSWPVFRCLFFIFISSVIKNLIPSPQSVGSRFGPFNGSWYTLGRGLVLSMEIFLTLNNIGFHHCTSIRALGYCYVGYDRKY